MGQYYVAVNLDKKQYIAPHECGNGAKLMEFGLSGLGMMSCLSILLADGNGRGGGDLHTENPLIGSWAGDRIVIAGDYADMGKFVDSDDANLYTHAHDLFENISAAVMKVLATDDYVRFEFVERVKAGRDRGGVYRAAVNK